MKNLGENKMETYTDNQIGQALQKSDLLTQELTDIKQYQLDLNIFNVTESLEPHIATSAAISPMLTDQDHFPYTRYYRGEPLEENPTIYDREAGWRPTQNSCYHSEGLLNMSMPYTSQGRPSDYRHRRASMCTKSNYARVSLAAPGGRCKYPRTCFQPGCTTITPCQLTPSTNATEYNTNVLKI
jgi:hypothetical protein